MKRALYLLSWYLVGFVFSAFFVLAHAETIPATYGAAPANWYWKVSYVSPSPKYATCEAAAMASASPPDYPEAHCGTCSGTRPSVSCQRYAVHTSGSKSYYGSVGEICDGTWNGSNCVQNTSTWYCPSTGGWTLSGTNCVRADCGPGQIRDANGICQSQACPTGQYSSGFYAGAAPAAACAPNGCMVSFTGSYPAGRDPQGNLYAQGSYSYMGGNQGECTPGQGGAVSAPVPSSTTPSSTSPGPNGCAPGDGVITSSSGKVACVPQGTPGATPAENNKTTKTETFSDGSTKTTTTTTVCTGDGACSSTTTVTVGAASGGAPGTAGQPGTTTTQTESGRDSDGDGDVDSKADCDPSAQMCGSPATDGLYTKKGKTFQGVFQGFANGVRGSPMGQATTGFFTVAIPAGACPDMSAAVEYLGITINLADYICTGTAIEMMQMAGAVLLAVATFAAFCWAFL